MRVQYTGYNLHIIVDTRIVNKSQTFNTSTALTTVFFNSDDNTVSGLNRY